MTEVHSPALLCADSSGGAEAHPPVSGQNRPGPAPRSGAAPEEAVKGGNAATFRIAKCGDCDLREEDPRVISCRDPDCPLKHRRAA